MALNEGYATVAYADLVNTGEAVWTALTTEEKENALSMGRYFIDSTYTCSTFTEPYPDELQTANSLLALEYANDNLFLINDTSGMLVAKSVKAGSVTISKEYAGRYTSRLQKSIDRYPQITALLTEYCSLASSTSLIRV